MKAEEIFQVSVNVMKELLTKEGMSDSIKRSKERGEDENFRLLDRERENINKLVEKIAAEGGAKEPIKKAPLELIDAMVIRYFRNRQLFMQTFPNGIANVYPDPISIWASIMISPQDLGSGVL